MTIPYCDFFYYDVGVALGKQVDALEGFKGDDPLDPFYPVVTEDLIIVDDTETEETNQRLYGPFTQITFHSDFASLLVEFYGVIKFLDDSFNAGGLVMQPDFSDNSNAHAVNYC